MFKNIFRLIFGNGIAQLIQLIAVPLLAILYSPESFGTYSLVVNVATILSVISILQLNIAIVTADNEKQVREIFKTASYTNSILTTLFLILLLMLYLPLSQFVTVELSFLLSLLVFVTSFNNLLRGTLVQQGRFSVLSRSLIIRSVAIVCSQVVFANVEIGLLYGLFLGELLLLLILIVMQRKVYLPWSTKKNRFSDLIENIRTHKDFTLYGTLQELVSVCIFSLPLLGVIFLYGYNIGGQYAIVSRLLWPATVLLTSSIAQVLLHRMAVSGVGSVKNTFFYSNINKIILFFFVIIASTIITSLLEQFVSNEWQESIDFAPFILMLCAIFFYSVPYRVVFRAVKKQVKILKLELVFLLMQVVVTALFFFKDIEISKYLLALVSLALLQTVALEYVARKEIKG